jgi:hypothetical protein
LFLIVVRFDGPLRGPNHPFSEIPGGGLGLEGSGFRKLNLANKHESSPTLFSSRMNDDVFFDEDGYELGGITCCGTDFPATSYSPLTYEGKGVSGWVRVFRCENLLVGHFIIL